MGIRPKRRPRGTEVRALPPDGGRVAVLASGNGSNFQALVDAMRSRIVALFCNRRQAFVLERARQAGIPAVYVPFAPFRERGREAYDADLAGQVAAFQPDLVVLAGWMHVLSPAFLDRLPPRSVLNLHPALLPYDPDAERVLLPDATYGQVFRGKDALEAALAAGATYVGSTVHRVTAQVDRGEVILQKALWVPPGSTFESVRERLLEVEHKLLPAAVERALAERLALPGRSS